MTESRLIHGLLGSLTLLVGVAVALKFAVAWIGKQSYTRFNHALFGAFAWILTAQGVSGAVYLARFFAQGVELTTSAWAHLGVSALAITLAQTYRAWTNHNDADKHRNICLTATTTLVLSILSMLILGKS